MHRPGSGLRRLIGLLLVLNLGTLLAGWAGSQWLAQRAPLVSFNAEKIRLLEDVLPERQGEAPIDAPESVAVAEMASGAACQGWTTLDADGVAQIEAHLRTLGVKDGAYDLVVEMRLGWWVYLPPFANAAALQEVIEDARAKGIKDMAPVRSGKMVNALALGAFPSYAAAREHARLMGKKGLSGVRYGPRLGAGKALLVVVQDSAQMQQALRSPWPGGLEPDACKGEQPGEPTQP